MSFLTLPLPAFAFYAALNGLLVLALAMLVVRGRVVTQTEIGDGGHAVMQRAMRAHGNAIEYLPIFLILLLALAEIAAPLWLIHAIGATGTLGRVLHAIGLSTTTGRSFGRGVGTLLTWIAILAAAIAILVLVVA